MAGASLPTTVERETRLGRVRGIERLGVETYRGLRYAVPVQRFRASAVHAQPWPGVYDATAYKAMAPQPPVLPEVSPPIEGGTFAEDCLFLNIHVPQAPAASPRPVIFFIHGGSFTGGSGNFYDGTALAKGADAVVVCINYRLGVFAAFDLEWLGTERDGGGQLWLGDQITALRWVRDNIADYGGNPGCVTVIGESAGAVSTAALCAAPEAEGLLHRAVACSTGYLLAEPSNDVVGVIAKTRRCTRAEAVAYLKSAPADELIRLQRRGKKLSPTPVANTPLLPGRMEDLIKARGSRAVPLIAGYATHEGQSLELMARLMIGLPWPLHELLLYIVARAIAMHGAKGREQVAGYLRRLKKATGSAGFGSNFHDVVWTDGFRRGAVEYCEMTSAAGSRAWLYVMDVPMRFAGKTIRSSHGIDLALTFNVGDDPEHTVPAFADHPDATRLARRWVQMLGHFARHGEPGTALGDWPAYTVPARPSMQIACDNCRVAHDVEALFRTSVWGQP
ncbi:MAG TPA: carboxylesterase family protein [Nevskiaceae bacterium]|nr:carboxylesterase family protein [Nevskiaceae bacterium]